jgi:hypothetical protein
MATSSIHDTDGFHYARGPSDVDLPHAFNVKHSRALRVHDKS